MGKLQAAVQAGIITVTGVTVTWSHYNSTTYPYSISQPSSYRHVVLRDTSNRRVDYFFPSLGSFTTNVNVYAYPGSSAPNEPAYLRSLGGNDIHRVAWLEIANRHLPLIEGHFKGIAAHWSMDQTTFVDHGLVWRLTASYDDRFRNLRPTLLRMLSSFRLANAFRTHKPQR